MTELTLNGRDASAMGIHMGDNFIEELEQPVSKKEYITNESRLDHGVRVDTFNPPLASREVTLTFVIHAPTKEAFAVRRKAFYDMLYAGDMTVRVADFPEVYKLRYLGKSISYGRSITGTLCTVTAKFLEADPSDRS